MIGPAQSVSVATHRDLLASAGHLGLLLAVAAATVALAAAERGSPAVALLPVALVAGAYVVASVPLRWSASALLFLSLALDERMEANYGQWRTPLAGVTDFLTQRLDEVAGLPLPVTGAEVLLLCLMAVWLHRRITGSRLDTAGQVEPALVIRELLLLCVAGVAFSETIAMAHGLRAAPWIVRNLLHPVMFAVLFLAAYRGPGDHATIGRLVVLAACIKSVIAIVVQRVARAETGGPYSFAVSHGDSILFAVAAGLVALDLLERPSRGRLARAAATLPLIVAGMIENDRRIVWVMLLLSFVAAYAVAPMRTWKRSLTRFAAVALPAILLYVGVGWDRGNVLFAPIQTLRGLTGSSTNRSSYWREVENWNIAMSMRDRPLVGPGLGASYTEYMANDDISAEYKEYRQWPHNSVIGLLFTMGLLGFTATWALPAAVLFLAIRSYRMAAAAQHRVAALGCMVTVIACQVMAWGDLGSHFIQYKVFVGLAAAVSARLAVVTGAWPARRRPSATQTPAPRVAPIGAVR